MTNSISETKNFSFVIKTLTSLILVLILFSISFSQEKFSNSRKIVFVNQDEFYLEKTGIDRISQAYKILDSSDCFSCWQQISQIETELKNPNLSAEIRNEKIEQIKKLQHEHFQEYKRREDILLKPVLKEIYELINKLETQNNFKILYFDELYSKGIILSFDERLDFTNTFINIFNNPTLNLLTNTQEIPNSKIAKIYTDKFFEKDNGIYQLNIEYKKIESTLSKSNESLSDSEKILRKDYSKYLQNIGNEIEEFSKSKGFNVVFDSSKEFPQELVTIDSQEITDEFIQYFNNKYR